VFLDGSWITKRMTKSEMYDTDPAIKYLVHNDPYKINWSRLPIHIGINLSSQLRKKANMRRYVDVVRSDVYLPITSEANKQIADFQEANYDVHRYLISGHVLVMFYSFNIIDIALLEIIR
jgi:hypothetical protein